MKLRKKIALADEARAGKVLLEQICLCIHFFYKESFQIGDLVRSLSARPIWSSIEHISIVSVPVSGV